MAVKQTHLKTGLEIMKYNTCTILKTSELFSSSLYVILKKGGNGHTNYMYILKIHYGNSFQMQIT